MVCQYIVMFVKSVEVKIFKELFLPLVLDHLLIPASQIQKALVPLEPVHLANGKEFMQNTHFLKIKK